MHVTDRWSSMQRCKQDQEQGRGGYSSYVLAAAPAARAPTRAPSLLALVVSASEMAPSPRSSAINSSIELYASTLVLRL
jgi:hypothetical protein